MRGLSEEEIKRYKLLEQKLSVYEKGNGSPLTPGEIREYSGLGGRYLEHTLKMARFKMAEALRNSPEGKRFEKMLEEQGRRGVVFHPCPHCNPPIREPSLV